MTGRWKLVSDGDRKYRLEVSPGRTVAWIRGSAIGLSGLSSDEEALILAPVLRRGLDEILAGKYPDRYRPVRAFDDLRLVHDGAYEWIAAGAVPIARLHRPRPEAPTGCFGIEFVLPSYASERVTVAGALMLAKTLHHGVGFQHFSGAKHVGSTTAWANFTATAASLQAPRWNRGDRLDPRQSVGLHRLFECQRGLGGRLGGACRARAPRREE